MSLSVLGNSVESDVGKSGESDAIIITLLITVITFNSIPTPLALVQSDLIVSLLLPEFPW